jgi:hypothetical protein
MQDDDAAQCPAHTKDGIALTSQILRMQEKIIMTDGYGTPAMLLFWVGLAALYAPRIRRACRPRLWRVSHSIPRPAFLTLPGRRR